LEQKVTNLKDVKEKIQSTMCAAAFAEAGEFDTARQLAAKGKNAHKKVLVVLEGQDLSLKILNYASDLCKRLGGQLEILHKKKPGQKDITQSDIWREFIMLEGHVFCTSLEPNESLDDSLVDYGKTRRDILCVVLRLDLMENKPDKKKDENFWSPDWIMEKLNCPVMVYS
jgi:hypothetical protein